MKTRLFLTIVFIITAALITPNILSAKDPAWVKLTYNLDQKSLEVIIGHSRIKGSTDHISRVEIKINGVAYKTFNYKYNVPNNSRVVYFYNDIQAKKGDRIEVTATSAVPVENGSKSCNIVVQEGVTQSN